MRQQRSQNGGLELYNGCGFTVSYAFCLQGASGTGYSPAFACKASMKSEGADNLRAGGTSGSFRATNIVFVACEGGSNLTRLEGGRGSCPSY